MQSNFFSLKYCIFVFIFFLFACKKECYKNIDLYGNVIDSNNLALKGVQVFLVERDGSQSLLGETNENGQYDFTLENKISLGGLYLILKKDGYPDTNTSSSPIDSGSGSCGNQTINRNVVMGQGVAQ